MTKSSRKEPSSAAMNDVRLCASNGSGRNSDRKMPRGIPVGDKGEPELKPEPPPADDRDALLRTLSNEDGLKSLSPEKDANRETTSTPITAIRPMPNSFGADSTFPPSPLRRAR
jgi:hypothetical protein